MAPAAGNDDLNGGAPDSSPLALLLIDVINDLEFPGGEKLLAPALAMAHRLAALKSRARAAGVPAIYVNDNFGRWRSDFRQQVAHCLEDGVRGEPLARLLAPEHDDYFVLKPKSSAFHGTTLEILLRHLGVHTLILTGLAGDICVLFSAADAHMRDYDVIVPPDCVASEEEAGTRQALDLMQHGLGVRVKASADIDWPAAGD